jgi:hypothetical protein
MTFELIYTTHSMEEENIKSSLLFDTLSITFIPGKTMSEKGVEIKAYCRT